MMDSGDGRAGDGAVVSDGRPTANRRRLPGINVRQGAVKQARLEARISLAQLGKGRVTAPAIYLIETGRTRPSLPTLEHIARRTGKPIEFFLADPGGAAGDTGIALLELELLAGASRFTEAVELGERLLRTATSAHGLGRIRYHTALSLLNLGRPADAAPLLKDAHRHFEASDDRLMLAECLGSEALLANLTENPEDVELARQAIELCRSLNPVPRTTEARLLGILGNCYVIRQDWTGAIQAYGEAIDAAGAVYDLRRLALTYADVSNAYRESGQLGAAVRFANRSIALFEVLRDQRNLARIENNLGLIMLATGDAGGARRHLDRSLDLDHESELEIGRSQVLLRLAELHLAQGDTGKSRELTLEALDLAERLGERSNIAEAHVWLGQAAEAEGDTNACDAEFQLAIDELTALGADERLLKCHGLYAEVLERRGEMDKAYAHMKKAFAASRPGMLHAQEDDEETANLA